MEQHLAGEHDLARRVREAAAGAVADSLSGEALRQRVLELTGVLIGRGGSGPSVTPVCRYCGAYGGGGHGGWCPGTEPGQ